MENNYQEKILDLYHSLEAVKDCFAISRLQGEINTLSASAVFNQAPKKELIEKLEELDEILKKYPDAVKELEY